MVITMDKKTITLEVSNLLSPTEAAKSLDITTMTLWRWVRDGKIIAIKLGRFNLIPRSEVDRLKK